MKPLYKRALGSIGALGMLLTSPLNANIDLEEPSISLELLSEFRTGIFDESAAEIVAFDSITNTLCVVNGNDETIDVLELASDGATTLLRSLDVSGAGGPTSVVTSHGYVIVTVLGATSMDRGSVVVFDPSGAVIAQVEVGYHPDNIVLTPDLSKFLVANEGELEDPEDSTSFDPVASISIIDIGFSEGELTFTHSFANGSPDLEIDDLVRTEITPGASLIEDLEPEYIAVSADSSTAWISLQESNAIAIMNLETNTIEKIVGMGYKNHAQSGNGIDASNDDGVINIRPWPVLGMYQPDTIASFQAEGTNFVITANEGDARDFEEVRVRDLILDPVAFPDADLLQQDENLGRLRVTNGMGDVDNDGDYDKLFSFGARSFSILDDQGRIVYDSGDEFEQILAQEIPEFFNFNNDDNDSFDSRSDDKGPEPEAITTGVVNGRTYAFIGLERIGGIMIYDITSPTAPFFVDYSTTRNFTGEPEQDTAGNLAPEGMVFIPAEESPTSSPLLVVAYEVSGSTAVFEIQF